MVAATLLVLFGGYLRKVLRAAEGEGHMLSSVVLAGATIVAVGAAFDATLSVALVETVDDIDPVGVQTLNALWNNDYIPIGLGAMILSLSAGLSVIRHGALPKWLGWAAISVRGHLGDADRLRRSHRHRPLDSRGQHHAGDREPATA